MSRKLIKNLLSIMMELPKDAPAFKPKKMKLNITSAQKFMNVFRDDMVNELADKNSFTWSDVGRFEINEKKGNFVFTPYKSFQNEILKKKNINNENNHNNY